MANIQCQSGSQVQCSHILTPSSFPCSKAEIEQFKACLAVVMCSRIGQDEYLFLHPICGECSSQEQCVLDPRSKTLRCIRCLQTRTLCPRQADFWITRVAKELSKPLEYIARMFEMYGRRRNRTKRQPRPKDNLYGLTDTFTHEDYESDSDTGNNASDASYQLPKDRRSKLKVDNAIARRSTCEARGKHEETQKVMAKVTKGLADLAEIEKQFKAMTIEITLQKRARVKAETQLTTALENVEKGQADASQEVMSATAYYVAICRDRLKLAVRPFEDDKRSEQIVAVVEELSSICEHLTQYLNVEDETISRSTSVADRGSRKRKKVADADIF